MRQWRPWWFLSDSDRVWRAVAWQSPSPPAHAVSTPACRHRHRTRSPPPSLHTLPCRFGRCCAQMRATAAAVLRCEPPQLLCSDASHRGCCRLAGLCYRCRCAAGRGQRALANCPQTAPRHCFLLHHSKLLGSRRPLGPHPTHRVHPHDLCHTAAAAVATATATATADADSRAAATGRVGCKACAAPVAHAMRLGLHARLGNPECGGTGRRVALLELRQPHVRQHGVTHDNVVEHWLLRGCVAHIESVSVDVWSLRVWVCEWQPLVRQHGVAHDNAVEHWLLRGCVALIESVSVGVWRAAARTAACGHE
eukprot:351429-Chlamydomonas_euryale.AAC.3